MLQSNFHLVSINHSTSTLADEIWARNVVPVWFRFQQTSTRSEKSWTGKRRSRSDSACQNAKKRRDTLLSLPLSSNRSISNAVYVDLGSAIVEIFTPVAKVTFNCAAHHTANIKPSAAATTLFHFHRIQVHGAGVRVRNSLSPFWSGPVDSCDFNQPRNLFISIHCPDACEYKIRVN